MMIDISNWQFKAEGDTIRLQGVVKDTSYFCAWSSEPALIVSSPIVSIRGRFVRTRSGRLYRLGKVNKTFLAGIKDYDPMNPGKIVGF